MLTVFPCLLSEVLPRPTIQGWLLPTGHRAWLGRECWDDAAANSSSAPTAEGGFSRGSAPGNTLRLVGVTATAFPPGSTTLSKLEWKLCAPLAVPAAASSEGQLPRGDTEGQGMPQAHTWQRAGALAPQVARCQVCKVGSLLAAVPAPGWEEGMGGGGGGCSQQRHF